MKLLKKIQRYFVLKYCKSKRIFYLDKYNCVLLDKKKELECYENAMKFENIISLINIEIAEEKLKKLTK